MPTRVEYPRAARDENERLRIQLEQVKQSCLLLNHRVEGSETVLTKQKETIVELKKQLKTQELRHSKELRALNEAHTQVLKNFVQKHSAQVSGWRARSGPCPKSCALVPEGARRARSRRTLRAGKDSDSPALLEGGRLWGPSSSSPSPLNVTFWHARAVQSGFPPSGERGSRVRVRL